MIQCLVGGIYGCSDYQLKGYRYKTSRPVAHTSMPSARHEDNSEYTSIDTTDKIQNVLDYLRKKVRRPIVSSRKPRIGSHPYPTIRVQHHNDQINHAPKL
jgi:hypothetical protein